MENLERKCDQCKEVHRIDNMGWIEVFYMGKKLKLLFCNDCLAPYYYDLGMIMTLDTPVPKMKCQAI